MAIVIPNPTDTLAQDNHAAMHGIVAVDPAAPTESIAVISSGYVGVGKTNPGTILDVNGTATATAFAGPLTGAVTGNVTGNLTGNVTGNLTGNVTGNASGTAATVTGAAQAAITSVGTLTAVTVSGTATVGTITDSTATLTGGVLSGASLGSGDFVTSGDGWSDYSATSTIVGWTSFGGGKNIYVKRVGRTVYVAFYISGVSNATTLSFTLPYGSSSSTPTSGYLNLMYASDNGGAAATGLISMLGSTSTVNLFKDLAEDAWTASGTKTVIGQFWYQSS